MILLNGRDCRESLAGDRALAYGDGVFETLAVVDGSPLCLEKHLERMRRGCEALMIESGGVSEFENDLKALAFDDLNVLKLAITRGAGGRGYRPSQSSLPNRLTSTHPWPYRSLPLPDRAWICEHRISRNQALAGIKHCNRLDQIMASSEWPGDDYLEGIMLDDQDRIIEGTRSNLFLKAGNEVVTPDLCESGVAGIVRELIIDQLKDWQIPCVVGDISAADLHAAEEFFICNSILGVRSISMIGETFTFDSTTLCLELDGALRGARYIA
ncbi:MAG: aminodeoxychorismate lyase [Pseudomonadota bacterium]